MAFAQSEEIPRHPVFALTSISHYANPAWRSTLCFEANFLGDTLMPLTPESFQTLFHHPTVMAFAERVITQSYVECAPGEEALMRDLLAQTFATLTSASSDERAFQAALTRVNVKLFRKPEPDFWFNRLYRSYKQSFKPADRFRQLREWLAGETVLDLGCGNGLTSAIVQQHGYRPYLTDVLDYRDPQAKDLPFAPMPNPHCLPYPGQHFDTGLVFAVLHHVAASDLLPLLGELRRACRRVIVEEDTYQLPLDEPETIAALERDAMLREFAALPATDQLRYLMFIDYFSNAITQGLPQMEMPFNFKPVGEWRALFEAQGWQVTHTVIKGFQPNYFNRSCHVWFILDRR
jgi:SAM-dependent methyltransferase